MGAEIFDVEINIDGVRVGYATKVSFKKNKSSSTKDTFDGDLNMGGNNTGGTISIERLAWDLDIDEAINMENKLESDNIEAITYSGTSIAISGDPIRKTVAGTGVSVSNDEEEWSPSDGISQKLEFNVNKLQKNFDKL